MVRFLETIYFVVGLSFVTNCVFAQGARNVVLLSCSGDPRVVESVQKNQEAPDVSLRQPCADAISEIMSSPFDDKNKDWNIEIAFSNKDQTRYLLWETVRIAGPQGAKGEKGEKGDTGGTGSGGAKAVILRYPLFTAMEIDEVERRIVLIGRDVGTGPFAGHALVYFNTQGKEGQVICRMGDLERSVSTPPYSGVIELGSTPLIPTSRITDEQLENQPNIDSGRLPAVVDAPIVTCHANLEGGSKALVHGMAEFIPLSSQSGSPLP